jgi:hypothetical protein
MRLQINSEIKKYRSVLQMHNEEFKEIPHDIYACNLEEFAKKMVGNQFKNFAVHYNEEHDYYLLLLSYCKPVTDVNIPVWLVREIKQ